jgi:hypothetical protein
MALVQNIEMGRRWVGEALAIRQQAPAILTAADSKFLKPSAGFNTSVVSVPVAGKAATSTTPAVQGQRGTHPRSIFTTQV